MLGGGGVAGIAWEAGNADLAAGSPAVIILEPLAHVSPRARFEAEPAELGELGDAAVAHIVPDEAPVAVFGVNVLDPALWRPAFHAGLAQAPAVTERVARAWKG